MAGPGGARGPLRRHGLALFLGAALLAGLSWAGYVLWVFTTEAKATTTIVRMRTLGALLDAERPADIAAPALAALLRREGLPERLEDGWGRPIEVARTEPSQAGGSPYLLRSLGRDGRRGPCCTRFAKSLDDDAVLAGEGFRQQWAPRSQRR